jgi:uncharacterized membrane protein HdeD (DUF308 family)
MLQLYFLSVFCNTVGGIVLITNFGRNDEWPRVDTYRFVLGILSVLTGLLVLISPIAGSIAGDLLPALAGLACGVTLIYEYFDTEPEEGDAPNVVRILLLTNQKMIGYISATVGILHFLLPKVMFL